MIVLDTDVVSEMMRAEPDASVVVWVQGLQPSGWCTTSVTVAEIRYGIARLPDGRRKDRLRADADRAFARFAGTVLPLDAAAAALHADVVVEREQAGTPISTFDALLAAIARSNGTRPATRNTDDFTGLGLDLVNPWEHPTS